MIHGYDHRNPVHVSATKERLLQAMRGGLTLKTGLQSANRPPDLPRLKTVVRWRKTDSAFDADVKAVLEDLRIAAGRRPAIRGAEGKAAALAAIRAGHSIYSLTRERPEGCPHVVNIAKWRGSDPHFAREFLKAMKERGVGQARRRLWLAGVRKYTAALPDLFANLRAGGSIRSFFRHRGWSDCSFRRFMKERPAVRKFYDAVLIQRGTGYAAVSTGPGFIPITPTKLATLRAAAVKLAARTKAADERAIRKEIDRLALRAARAARKDEQQIGQAQVVLKKQALKNSERDAGLKFQAGLLRDRIYAAADQAVSKRLEPDDRADIIVNIVMAVLEEEITFEEIKTAAAAFASEHMAAFKSQQVASLDEELFSDSSATRMDFLSVDPLYAE